ncbi:MFS transporter [Nocardia asteroides]|uniref:MFS transporter n=1 Tax=Nocardia asteroides TaxID=1824 RepID=UPI003443C664
MNTTAMATLGSTPLYLLSVQAVSIRSELSFGAAQFGVLISGFFVAAALVATLSGPLFDRIPPHATVAASGALAVLGNLGVAALATGFGQLAVGSFVLGAAHAATQMSANTSVNSAIPADRQGVAFAIKQASGPLGLLTAALFTSVLGATFGWRWTFVAAAALSAIATAAGLRGARRIPSVTPHPGHRPRRRPAMAPLLTAVAGMSLACVAATAMSAFVTTWGIEVGLSETEAAYTLAAGSVASVAARILVGIRADRRARAHLPAAAIQMLCGAVGLVIMAVPAQPTYWLAVALAFTIGWAWPGICILALMRIAREAPGTVSGYVQGGMFLGGALGPVLFGFGVALWGFSIAWLSAAVVLTAGAALLIAARRMFIRAGVHHRAPSPETTQAPDPPAFDAAEHDPRCPPTSHQQFRGEVARTPAEQRKHMPLSNADRTDEIPDRRAEFAKYTSIDPPPAFGEFVESMRAVLDLAVSTDGPNELYLEARRHAQTLLGVLGRYSEAGEGDGPANRAPSLPGRGSLLNAPWELVSLDAEGMHTIVRLSRFHVGGHSAVHGGVVAQLFDDHLGWILYGRGLPIGRTAYLHVNYRRVTPIDEPITLRGRVTRVEGRKMFVEADLRREGGDVVADCEALLVALKPGQP